jgi:hypothetical protein
MPAAPFTPGAQNAQQRNLDPQPAAAPRPSNDYIGSPAMMATYNDPLCGRIPAEPAQVALERIAKLRATAAAVGCISEAQCTTREARAGETPAPRRGRRLAEARSQAEPGNEFQRVRRRYRR